MLFTSYEFLAFIIILFILYYIVPGKFQWHILLVFSFIFYFSASPRYFPYICFTVIVTYVSGILIQKKNVTAKVYLEDNKELLDKDAKKAYKRQIKNINKRTTVVCIVINIGVLIALKYTNFFIGNINGLMHFLNYNQHLPMVNLLIPMGISFYTFMALGYIIDVYRGTISAEKNIGRFALFLMFFPSIVQGPINRFKNLSETLFVQHKLESENISTGLWRILWGYFKKLVVADRLMTFVIAVIANDEGTLRGGYAFFGMVFYTIQLYADFTGGIDITIGIAKILGIEMVENFDKPYFSTTLKEYWRRWHITMCSWFRDYVFYPVSTSKWMINITKWSKKNLGETISKRIPVYISSFIVWFLTGFWHGASWNFIVWGLLNFAFLMISEELEPVFDKLKLLGSLKDTFAYKIFQIVRTFVLVCILNLFDCFEKINDTISMLLSIFTVHNWSDVLVKGGIFSLGLDLSDFFVLMPACILMLAVSGMGLSGNIRQNRYFKHPVVRVSSAVILFISVVVFGAYGIGYDASQFIYNRF